MYEPGGSGRPWGGETAPLPDEELSQIGVIALAGCSVKAPNSAVGGDVPVGRKASPADSESRLEFPKGEDGYGSRRGPTPSERHRAAKEAKTSSAFGRKHLRVFAFGLIRLANAGVSHLPATLRAMTLRSPGCERQRFFVI